MSDYSQLYADIETAFAACKPDLDLDTIDEIRHFIDHDEIEMAFELLGIDLIVKQKKPPENIAAILYSLGLALGLDKESVYNIDFWPKFLALIKRS